MLFIYGKINRLAVNFVRACKNKKCVFVAFPHSFQNIESACRIYVERFLREFYGIRNLRYGCEMKNQFLVARSLFHLLAVPYVSVNYFYSAFDAAYVA